MKRDGMMEIWKYGTKTQKQGTKKENAKKHKDEKHKDAQSYKIRALPRRWHGETRFERIFLPR